MSSFPSLPLFTDAFLADTGHLSAQETGAYVLLLMMAWRLPDCRLPDDDAKLCRWARLDRRTWLRLKPVVMEFWVLQDGFWTQKRLSKERDVVSKRAEVARQNGKHGGRPKSLENKELENQAGSLRDTQQKAPNPIPIEKENTKEKPHEPESRSAERPPLRGGRATPNTRPDWRTGRRNSDHIATAAAAVFVREGTPAFSAWQRALGSSMSTTTHLGSTGRWCRTEWPSNEGFREAAE
jgi:uncharacterized protein YdaU (DUF1376 family)